jgi:hypothetical protein
VSPSGTRSSPPGPAAANVTVTNISLVATNATVAVVAQGTVLNVTPGANFNASADVSQACGHFGCSSGIASISIAAPFALVLTSPALPFNYDSSGSVELTLEIRAPSQPGSFSVNGSLRAFAPPGPTVVSQLGLTAAYTGLDVGFLTIQGPSLPLYVRPNASFLLNLTISSSSWFNETVAGFSLGAPFRLVDAGTPWPRPLAPNGSFAAQLTVAAGAPGNYSLNGTLAAGPTPVATVGNVTLLTSITYNPFYLNGFAFSGHPSVVRLGERFGLALWINNTDSAAHVYEVTSLAGPWIMVSFSPHGNVSIPANGSAEWTFVIEGPPVSGYYNIVVRMLNSS